MELTTIRSPRWDFDIIDSTHEGQFVHAVVEDYTYSVGESFELVPEEEPFCIQTFIYQFQDSYMIFENVLELELYPELNWDGLTDDEQSDIHEEVAEEAAAKFYAYIADVMKVLDSYQLFYVAETPPSIYTVIENHNRYRNSPLQEVW